MDHHLRHRSASGSLENMWELDDDGMLLACIKVAAAPIVHVGIKIANVRRRDRARGEYAVWSVSAAGDIWRVEHGHYDAHLPDPILPDLSLVLTHAPPEVAERLTRIGAGDPTAKRYITPVADLERMLGIDRPRAIVPDDDTPTSPDLHFE